MKKIVGIVLAVLLVAWLATAWFIGGSSEKGLNDFYNNAEAWMGGGSNSPVQFDSGEFKRGFFSSTATTKMQLADLPIEELSANIETKIYHGPLMFTSDGVKVGASYSVSTVDTSGLPQEAQKLIEKMFDGEEPLTVGVATGFGGSQDMTMKMPSMRHTVDEEDGSKSKIMFAGMNASIHGTVEPDSPMDGTITIGEFRITNDAQQTSFSTGIGKGEIDITEVQNGMTVAGTSSLVFDEFKGNMPTGDFSIKDVAMRSESIVDSDTNAMGGFFRMEFGSASGTDNTGMAEGLMEQLNNGGRIEFIMKGWSIDALHAFNDANAKMSKIQGEMTAAMMGEEAGDFDMEKAMEDMQAATSEVFDAALALFSPGMLIEIQMKLGDGDGRSEIKIGIGYAEGATPASEAKTIGDFVDGMTVDVAVRLSKAMLPEGMGEAMLTEPAQQGLIEDRGTYYRGTAELRTRKVTVNGNEMPVLDQFAPIMEQELSMEGLMGAFMGMGGGMGEPEMEGGFPEGLDAPAPGAPDAAPAVPDAAPAPAPNPQ